MAAPSKAAVVLKAVKRIAVHFSPFESNVRSTRYESLFLLVDIVCVVVLRSRHEIPVILSKRWMFFSGCFVITGKLARCYGPA